MSDRHKKYYDTADQLMETHGVNFRAANDVQYLRQQPHWSPALEQQFIGECQKGEVPDVTKYGT